MNRKIMALIAIILLGTALRLYDLTQESLWTDEIISLNHAQQPTFSEVIDSVVAIELTPPGYYLLLSQWIGIFGTSEFSLRFFPLFFDIAAILLVYVIGKRLASAKIGLLGALIYATSLLPIVYAQEARHYSMFGFLALLSSLMLINAIKNKWLWVPYALIQFSALSISYTGAFVFLFHGIALWFAAKQELRRYALAVGAVIVLFLPQVNIALTVAAIRHAALQEALFLRGVPAILSQLGMFFYVLPVLLLGVLFALLLLAIKRIKPSQEFLSRVPLVLMLFWAVLHTIFLEQTLRSFALIRHSFFVVPFIYLTFAYGLDKLRSRKVWIAIVTTLLLFNAGTLAVYYTTTTKAPWREAVFNLEAISGPKDIILFDRAGANVDLYTYYAAKPSRPLALTTWYNNGTFVETDTWSLNEQLESEQQFWFISSRNFRTEDKYQKFLDENYQKVDMEEYKELKVARYDNE